MEAETKVTWSFGFGSNMDVEFMRNKKRLNVLDHTPAVLKGWKMMMTLTTGMQLVEPSFANACRSEGDEIHGLAFALDDESLEKLKIAEGGGRIYDCVDATFEGYDGRTIQGFMFSHQKY